MRTRLLAVAAALLLASAGTTYAQDQAADAAFNQNIWANIGFSASSVKGDRARFDRFSDLRQNGLALDVFGEKVTPDLRVQFGGQHVGYDDQTLFATINAGGKVKASVSFDGQPLNYGFKDDGYVQTPYGGDDKLDYATRAAVQAGTAIAVPGNPSQRTSFLGFYHPIDLKSLRNTFDGPVRLLADRAGGREVPREDVHAAGDAAVGRVGTASARRSRLPRRSTTARRTWKGSSSGGTSTGP